jgi:N-acetylmuramoyl-L-alanine amidase
MVRMATVIHGASHHSLTIPSSTTKWSHKTTHPKSRILLPRQNGLEAGPHLFVDDKQIWVFTPLTLSGTHSPSWNKVAIGVEILGDYDKDAFNSGRGLKVQKDATAAIATLSAMLGVEPDTMRLHKEDPLTTHACPGKT